MGKTKTDAGDETAVADFKTDYTGPQPHFPHFGESWKDTSTDPPKIKYWHGSGWYLTPPTKAGTGEAATETMKEASQPEVQTAPEPEAEEAIEEEQAAEAAAEDDTDVEEVSLSVERMEAAASEYQLSAKTLVADVRDFLLEQIKMRPKPWSATSENEQRDVAAACEHASVELVRKIVEELAAEDRQPIRAILESYTEKEGIKLSMKVKAFSEEEELAAVLALHKARGKHVLIVAANVDDYRGGDEAEIDPDQPGLGFEAGSDDHPEDDSDLAGDEDQA